MVITVDEAGRHILDTLSSDEMPRVGQFRVLNDAGEYFTTCKVGGWSWLVGRRVSLPFEAGQGHVWLPRDFRSLISYAASGFTNNFILGGNQDITDIRTKAIAGTNWPYRGVITHAPRGAAATGELIFTGTPADAGTLVLDDGVNTPITFEFDTAGDGVSGTNIEIDNSASGITAAATADLMQAAVEGQFVKGNIEINAVIDATNAGTVNLTNRRVGTNGNIAITDAATLVTVTGMTNGRDPGRPEARIDLSTNPEADLEDALTIYYRAGWTHVNEDDDFMAVPEWCEQLYLQIVRAVARGYHREDMKSMSERLVEIVAGPIMAAASDTDDGIQPDLGEMRGGAMQHAIASDPFWNFQSTAGPS